MTSHQHRNLGTSARRRFLRRAARLAAIAGVAFVALLATGTSFAQAATVPYHRYSYSCSPGVIYLPGDNHPYYLIKIEPEQIDPQQAVATQYLNSPTYHQHIYFWLWVWTKTASGWQWQHTAAKRVLDGWPVNYTMEAWDRQVGAWMNSSLGDFYDPTTYDPNNPSNTSDMLVLGYELGMYVRADLGVKTWTFTAETYWAPPFTGSAPSPYDPTIPSGGLNWYDTTSGGGWPTVTCA